MTDDFDERLSECAAYLKRLFPDLPYVCQIGNPIQEKPGCYDMFIITTVNNRVLSTILREAADHFEQGEADEVK